MEDWTSVGSDAQCSPLRHVRVRDSIWVASGHGWSEVYSVTVQALTSMPFECKGYFLSAFQLRRCSYGVQIQAVMSMAAPGWLVPRECLT